MTEYQATVPPTPRRASAFVERPMLGRIALYGMLGSWLVWYALTASNLLPGAGPFWVWLGIIVSTIAVAISSIMRRERLGYAASALCVVGVILVSSVILFVVFV